jgi:hypothetical protein
LTELLLEIFLSEKTPDGKDQVAEGPEPVDQEEILDAAEPSERREHTANPDDRPEGSCPHSSYPRPPAAEILVGCSHCSAVD